MGKNHKDPVRSSWVSFHVRISGTQGQGVVGCPNPNPQPELPGSDLQLCQLRIRDELKGQDAASMLTTIGTPTPQSGETFDSCPEKKSKPVCPFLVNQHLFISWQPFAGLNVVYLANIELEPISTNRQRPGHVLFQQEDIFHFPGFIFLIQLE